MANLSYPLAGIWDDSQSAQVAVPFGGVWVASVAVHALTADNLAVAVAIQTATLGQKHALTAGNLAVAVAITTPTLGQVHALTAGNLAVGVALTTPTLAESHALTANNLSVAVAIQTPTPGQVHALTAGNLAVAVSIQTPTLGQIHALTANNLSVASTIVLACIDPKFEDYTTYTKVEVASDIDVSSKFLDFDIDAQSRYYVVYDKGVGHFNWTLKHALHFRNDAWPGHASRVGIWALANTVGTWGELYAASNDWLGVNITGNQFGPYPSKINLTEQVGTTRYIDFGNVDIPEGTDVYLEIEVDRSIGTYGQITCRAYSDSNRTTLLDTVQLTLHSNQVYRYIYGLQASYPYGLDVGNVVGQVGPLSLSAEHFHVLYANNLAVGVALTTPTAAEGVHALTANNLSVAVAIQTPTLGQVHALASNNLSVAVAITTPTVAEGTDNLTADSLAVAVAITTPVVGQVHALTANNLAVAVTISIPAPGQIHALTVGNLSVAVSMTTPTLAQESGLSANNLTLALSIESPTAGQVHALTSNGLTLAVAISTPTAGESALAPDNLSVAVSLSSPTVTQAHALTASSLSVACSIGTPTLTLSISASYILYRVVGIRRVPGTHLKVLDVEKYGRPIEATDVR